MKDCVVIGGATGFWGDTAFGGPQLLASGRCDYIMFEALAEITMGILSRAHDRDPNFGYATDIVRMIGRDLAGYREQGIRIVTNAGGVHPGAAAEVLREMATAAGVRVSIATITGDDLTADADALAAAGVFTAPAAPLGIHAYLGARPIAAALDAGADIVITGRCVDSALALGPLIHEFGWGPDDLDALAQGTLAGHLLECGPQSTGGLLTDWEDVASWEALGQPIAECRPDGSFVLTKPAGTGGLVDRRTVSEQLVYEIGDPARYLVPDVTCDWRHVELAMDGPDRVRVRGARGAPPPPTLKACAQVPDGFKVKAVFLLGGRAATAKAHRVADDVLARAARVLARDGQPPLADHDIEILGAEATYGPHARAEATREVVIKVGLVHESRAALDTIVRELPSFGLCVPGLSGGGLGLARATPRLRLHGIQVPASLPRIAIELDGVPVPYTPPALRPAAQLPDAGPPAAATPVPVDDPVTVPLCRVAHGRSGDKGADANIGIIARHRDFLSLLRATLTADRVRAHMAHRVDGDVERFDLPGIGGLNFLLHDALGGGGIASLRFDAQGKAYAQQLLDMPIDIPRAWLDHPSLR
jgi:hypothetical protein